MNPVQNALTHSFLTHLVSTPEGRAFLLAQIADAEDNGEARLFDDLLAQVDDEKLAKMIQRHRDDEIRHGVLFRERAEATGVPVPDTPEEVRVLDKINLAADGVLEQPITDPEGVMRAYVLLQVVEERAITQFRLHKKIFAAVDPITVDVFEEVERDERRHLKYCHAIARRYAPSEAVHKETIRWARALEAQAFCEVQNANVRVCLDRGIIKGPLRRLFWRAVHRMGEGPLPFTPIALADGFAPIQVAA